MSETFQSLKEKVIYLIQHQKPDEDPKIEPKLKDLFNLDNWAYKNNLFVHPAYRQAVKQKEKILVMASITAGILVGVTLILIIIFR